MSGYRSLLAGVFAGWLAIAPVFAATMFSQKESFMGAGTFYGPGKIQDSILFDAVIEGIGFSSALNFVTPMSNNGGAAPNICADSEIRKAAPTGMLSDGVTRINENVSACAFVLNNTKVLVAIVDGGPHQGKQVAYALEDKGDVTMIMTMDFAMDMGVGKAGVIRMPFYGTTGEVTVPYSLQTQMGLPGGIDTAGSLKPGEKLRGRIGDFNNDGMLDGAIVVAGNIPLDSIFMPGAPYALIRYFETNVPYSGVRIGSLPGRRAEKGKEPKAITVTLPTASNSAQVSSAQPHATAKE